LRRAGIGYGNKAFTYPCMRKSGELLAIHCKSEDRDAKGKRRQWWRGFADDLPSKGHGKRPDEPAKVIPFGLETLINAEPSVPVLLCCGEEDALSLRQTGYTALSQPGAGLLEPVYAREFAGFEVVVFYDAGEEPEARKDAMKLLDAGASSVRVVRWPTGVRHGTDINGRLVQDPEGFRAWVARMIAQAESLGSFGGEENRGREGEPDTYAEFPDPDPLPEGLPPVASFDPEMLPGPLRPWVLDIAERMQVPLDYVAAGAVAVAASLVGRKIGIRPKRYDDWLVVAVIWAGIVGPPSTLKSPALAEITRPLDRLVAEAREAHAAASAEHEAEAAAVEATKSALKKEIDRAAKAHVKTGDRSELDDLIARQRDAKPPKPPTERRYKTSDPTVEKLAELLRDNPRGILVQRDELTGWLRSLDRQGREVDRAFYLEAWNGTGPFSVDRIGRGTLHVPALCVSILGGIQPGPLSSYVFEAARGGAGADGLLQRFQLLVWPDPPRGRWRNVDRYPDAEAKNRAFAAYRALDGLSPEEIGATAEGGEDIPAVRFSSGAQEVFDRWREELEAKLRADDEGSPALTSHLAKYRSLMPALALVFHLIAVADGSTRGGPVGIEAATRAAAWCEYLETHAQRLYASAENSAMEGARALLSRIRKGDVKDGDTVRSVYRKQWNRLSSSEAVTSAVAVLEDHGWLRVEEAGTGGRPTRCLRLHPRLKGGT
jgi:hypothetical protein